MLCCAVPCRGFGAAVAVVQVHTFYTYELKELFNVAPDQVLKRLANSFLPGWHAPLLQHPDMYGPLLAVFMLPQVS